MKIGFSTRSLLCLALMALVVVAQARALDVPLTGERFLDTLPSAVAFHWRAFRELLTLSVQANQARREPARVPVPEAGPLRTAAFEHWLDAFAAAPQFSPLVDDLGRRRLLDEMLKHCRAQVKGRRRQACLLVLSSMEREVADRLSFQRQYSLEYPTFSLFHVWRAGTLAELHKNAHTSSAAARDGCRREAVENIVRALELDPFEESAYARLTQLIPENEAAGSYHGAKVPGRLRDLVAGMHHLMAASEEETPIPGQHGASRDERFRLAREAFHRVDVQAPQSPEGPYLSGVEAFHRRDHAEAIRQFERARTRTTWNATLEFILGRALMEAGRFTEASKRFADVAARHVEPGAWHNIAVCLQRQKRLPEARAAYLKVLDLNPFYEAALLNLAVLELRWGAQDRARPYLTALVAYHPGNAQGLYWMGVLAARADDINAAGEYLQSCIKLQPRFGWARLQLSSVLVRREDHDQALAVLAPLASSTGDARAALRRQVLFVLRAKLAKAIEWDRAGRRMEAAHELRAVEELLGPEDSTSAPLTHEDTVLLRRLIEERLRGR
ncbi:MAG: tetratricopeptide repeat protein [Candidatus Riflebacteria bacterium]|nr:tetratricopeptide repeat protein [Candidatus Riflebacteria bacterium]